MLLEPPQEYKALNDKRQDCQPDTGQWLGGGGAGCQRLQNRSTVLGGLMLHSLCQPFKIAARGQLLDH